MADKRPIKRQKIFLEPNYDKSKVSRATDRRWTALTAEQSSQSAVNKPTTSHTDNDTTEHIVHQSDEDLSTADSPHHESAARFQNFAGSGSSAEDDAPSSGNSTRQNVTLQPDSIDSDSEDSNCSYDSNDFFDVGRETDAFENDHTVIFAESGITVAEVYMMVTGLSTRFNFSYESQLAIYKLIKVLAGPRFNDLRISKYCTAQKFSAPQDVVSYVYYCPKCNKALSEPLVREKIKNEGRICDECEQEYKLSLEAENRFICVDLEYQIRAVLKSIYVWNDLKENVIRISERESDTTRTVISDVHDSKLYKNIQVRKTNKGVTVWVLTYTFNTDGAPIFKSSKRSFWPLQLILNELSPKLRYTNIMLAAIAVMLSEPKPDFMKIFMGSFERQVERLATRGLKIISPDGESIKLKFFPLAGVLDTVARPIVQNRVQFNGYWGCSWCYAHGEYLARSMRYPLKLDQDELRTNKSHEEDTKEANRRQLSFRGVKGSTKVSDFPFFDCVWGFPLDYMHGMVLGVGRQVWDVWTTPGSQYSLDPSARKEIDERLLNIQPPREIYRTPRSLRDRSKWKAAEWRSWLLFYSFPCLQDILDPKVLESYMLFVRSIHTLLQPNISENDLRQCSIDLFQFVGEFQIYFGKAVMTFNVHSVLHLVQSVRESGPLWATSAFPYESAIYVLKQQVCSPKSVDEQMVRRLLQRITYKSRIQMLPKSESCASYCDHILSAKKSCTSQFVETENATLLGVPETIRDVQKYVTMLETDCEYAKNWKEGSVFTRCIFRGTVYGTNSYSGSLKTNDSIVQLHETNRVVKVMEFVVFNENCFVTFTELITKPVVFNRTELPHTLEVTGEKQPLKMLPIECIKCKLVNIDVLEKQFVCRLPNDFEIL